MSKTRASYKAVQLKHDTSEEEEDDEDQQQQQQQRPRRNMHTVGETGSGSGVPAFLAKLWRLVDDPDTNNLICWSKDGRSFIIQNQAQFARELLPLNYKHNNMASFIRQLNMYGFHKITSIENGGLRFDRDEIEFSHPCFKRNYPYLLDRIKRKISNTKTVDEKSVLKQETVSKVLNDVKAMRGRQDNLDSRFSVMKQENEALWREIASLRQKHAKQQQIVNKLIQFLISIVQPSRNMSGVKRHMQLMINDTPENARKRNASESESEGGAVIHEMRDELLDEVMNPNSPYVKQYDAESVSPLAMERPRSNMSVTSSQNYDYSNHSADDFIAAQLLNSGETPTNAALSPSDQEVLYTVTEVPETHAQEQQYIQPGSNSPYGTDEQTVLTTPMVRQQEARNRQLLKEKNKQRRNADAVEQVNVDVSAKALRTRSQSKEQQQTNVMPQPLLVKTEPELGSTIGGGNMPSLIDRPESTNADLFNVDFISNDMPNIFEDDSNSCLDEQSAKLDQQQQFGRTTVNNGRFANMPMSFDLANSNNENPLVTDVNLASTSKAAAVKEVSDEKQKQQQQQQQQQQPQQQPMTVAKYTGDNGHETRLSDVSVTEPKPLGCESIAITNNIPSTCYCCSDEVTGHLDNMQDELDTLKDLLRGEGVSIDQNMIMGLFNDSDVLDNYGLSFLNDTMSGDKKASSGSELMTYQPNMYDLSDILDSDDNKANQGAANPRQLQSQSSVLNTPRHD